MIDMLNLIDDRVDVSYAKVRLALGQYIFTEKDKEEGAINEKNKRQRKNCRRRDGYVK